MNDKLNITVSDDGLVTLTLSQAILITFAKIGFLKIIEDAVLDFEESQTEIETTSI